MLMKFFHNEVIGLFGYIDRIAPHQPTQNILQIVDSTYPDVWFLVFQGVPEDILELIELAGKKSTFDIEERITEICVEYIDDAPGRVDSAKLVWIMQNNKATQHLQNVVEVMNGVNKMAFSFLSDPITCKHWL